MENNFTQGFQNFFGPLSTAQRVLFTGLVIVVFSVIGGVLYWSLKPDYTILFGSLPGESAREVIEQLDEQNVKYKLENNGRSIYVPSDKVHELRINLAAEGLGQSTVQGYELFDTNSLGMTDFMQQVTNKRALEGELARSINTLEQVESTRIHLVLPERSPFQENSVEASASVVLSLKSGKRLSNQQVEGITSLIAGSVVGLNMQDVTVLDQAGNRLTDKLDSHQEYASGTMQMQLREQTETYLTERGQSMLDQVLGPGNSVVRVSAEHDFARLIRESDIVDPDSRIIISEERRREVNNDETMEPVQIDEFTPIDQRGESVITSTRETGVTNQTRNYEISRTREVYEKTQGEIKRITASVLLNYKESVVTGEDGETQLVTEPFTDQEIEEFREIVGMSLGLQPERGDQLSITQVQFYDRDPVQQPGLFVDHPSPNIWFRWGLIVAAILTVAGLIYSMRRRLSMDETGLVLNTAGKSGGTLIEGPDGETRLLSGDEDIKLEDIEDEHIEDFYNRKLSGKARANIEQKTAAMEEIKNFVELKPAEAVQVLRSIMKLSNK